MLKFPLKAVLGNHVLCHFRLPQRFFSVSLKSKSAETATIDVEAFYVGSKLDIDKLATKFPGIKFVYPQQRLVIFFVRKPNFLFKQLHRYHT